MRIGSGTLRIGVTRSESKKFTSRVRVFGAERKRERESFGDRDNRERYVLLLCWSGEG